MGGHGASAGAAVRAEQHCEAQRALFAVVNTCSYGLPLYYRAVDDCRLR